MIERGGVSSCRYRSEVFAKTGEKPVPKTGEWVAADVCEVPQSD